MSRPTPSKARDKNEIEDYATFIKKLDRTDLEDKSNVKLIGYKDVIKTLKQKIRNISTGQQDFAIITGPSGTGKTTIVRKLAESSELNYIYLKASWLLEKGYNPETQLRQIFREALAKAPSLVFIDDIHQICEKKRSPEANRAFNVLTDRLEWLHGLSAKVLVLSATDRPHMLDPDIRKTRYFKNEIKFNLPNGEDRLEKLTSILASQVPASDIEQIAHLTHCYLYKDLEELCEDADKLDLVSLKAAIAKFKPTATSNVTTPCPPLKWEDIGGVNDVKRELEESVIWPIMHREEFTDLGIVPSKGALLYGPPGCSKTMLAQALATESGYNFISVKGPELFSKWVGDSEAAVRKLYRSAREVAPSIIFFDEIDGFASERSDNQNSSVGDKVVAQLLTELNGIEPLDNVFTIAATNRPDKVDSALMRPGRLDPAIYIPLPADGDRAEIFKVHMRRLRIQFGSGATVETFAKELASRTDGYSGAEIANVCRMAALSALRERKAFREQKDYEGQKDLRGLEYEHIHVQWKHFENALQIVKPTTRIEHLQAYSKFHQRTLQLGQRPSLVMDTPLQFCEDFDSKVNIG